MSICIVKESIYRDSVTSPQTTSNDRDPCEPSKLVSFSSVLTAVLLNVGILTREVVIDGIGNAL